MAPLSSPPFGQVRPGRRFVVRGRPSPHSVGGSERRFLARSAAPARARETGTGGMSRRLLRQPRTTLALTTAIVGFGVFSSSIGTGALPTASLPPFGVTAGDGSLSTVAELGDVNGDHFGDYAVGLPSANADAGIVYVFLGQARARCPPRPRRSTSRAPRSRSRATRARCSATRWSATTSTTTASPTSRSALRWQARRARAAAAPSTSSSARRTRPTSRRRRSRSAG